MNNVQSVVLGIFAVCAFGFGFCSGRLHAEYTITKEWEDYRNDG